MANEDLSRPGKNLVLCSDGTGQRGGRTITNVWRIYQAIDRTLEQREQLAFYEDGVGSESYKPVKTITGATGIGLSTNIRMLYRWLMLNYSDGDQIYLFGFSRGAYTVRTLAGMLKHCGLVYGDHLHASDAEDIAAEVYNDYYRGKIWSRLLKKTKESRRRLPSDYQPAVCKEAQQLQVTHPDIRFLGVWDTVGAIGLPPWLRGGKFSPITRLYQYHDINANNWKAAAHALAIDDERKTFWPELLPQASEGQDQIDQIWFAGVHTNIGGGYPKDGLAFSTLDWMMTKAKQAGLIFTLEAEAEVRHRKNAHDRIYDSRAGMRAYYRYAPRDFNAIKGEFTKRHACEPHPLHKVHEDVFERIRRSTMGYAPPQLPAGIEVEATGKAEGGALDRAETLRVADFKERLARSDQAGRSSKLQEINGLIKWRKVLYLLLVLFTLVLIGNTIWLLDENPLVMGEPNHWLAKLGTLILPKFVEDLIVQYYMQAKEHPVIAILSVVLLISILWSRHKVMKKTERLALEAWHTFRTPHPGRGKEKQHTAT